MSLTTEEIQHIIGKDRVGAGHTCVCRNVKYLMMCSWEMDVISVNKSGYLVEYEVKVSKADFRADAKKGKWSRYESGMAEGWAVPNYHYYVIEEGLLCEGDIPPRSGFITVTKDGMIVQKRAPLIHGTIHDINEIRQKVLRLWEERTFLGATKLTIKNAEIRKGWMRHQLMELLTLKYEMKFTEEQLKEIYAL